MATTPITSFRLNIRLKARLRRIANAENRDLSYIVDRVLTDYAEKYESRKGWKDDAPLK